MISDMPIFGKNYISHTTFRHFFEKCESLDMLCCVEPGVQYERPILRMASFSVFRSTAENEVCTYFANI